MKKKTVVLMFVLALSLSIVGCGNQTTTAEEPQQEQMEVETEQPEQTETEMEEPQQEQAELETEEPQQEESVETEPVYSSPDELYENALSVLDEVIDTEKLYTSEEFAELLPQIFDKIDDITFNPDLVADVTESQAHISLHGAAMKDTFQQLFFHMYLGMGNVKEVGI